MNGAFPHLLDAFQRGDGELDLQIRAAVAVAQIQLAAVSVVAVHHVDVGLPMVGEHEQQLLFDFVEVVSHHDHASGGGVIPILVELLILDELGRQELVEKGYVVVQGAHLIDLFASGRSAAHDTPFGRLFLAPFPARGHVLAGIVLEPEAAGVPTPFDIAEQFEPEFVGVESTRSRRQRSRMVIAVIDKLRSAQHIVGHDRRVPVTGPTLVHDLGLPLGREVISLLANHAQDVRLPVLQGCILHKKQQDISQRFRRKPILRAPGLRLIGFAVAGQALRWVDVPIHVALCREARDGVILLLLLPLRSCRLLAAAHEHRMRIDKVLEGEEGVKQNLHAVVAMPFNVTADPRAMIGHLVDHPAVRLAEPDVVLEEVAVGVDVGDHRLVVDRHVVVQEVGVAGVVVDDHFINAA